MARSDGPIEEKNQGEKARSLSLVGWLEWSRVSLAAAAAVGLLVAVGQETDCPIEFSHLHFAIITLTERATFLASWLAGWLADWLAARATD